jgi:hypothetical protein
MTKELALASQQRLIVIPLRVEDVTPGDAFTYEFATRQWIDVFADWESSIDQLCRRITRALENPALEEDDAIPPVAEHELAPEGDHVETAAEFAHTVAPAAVVAPIIDPDADEQEALDEAAFAAAGVPDGVVAEDAANENRSKGMMRIVLVAAALAVVAGLGVIAPKFLHKPRPGATVTAAVKPEGLIDAANKGPSATAIGADPRAAVALTEAPVVEEPAAAPAPRAKRRVAKAQVETDIPY